MKWYWLILSLSVSVALGQPAADLSLTDALDIGARQNRILLLSAARVQGEQSRAAEAGAVLYPGLSFVGSYTRIQDGAFRLSTTNLPVPVNVGNVVPDNYVLRVGLRQPLFTGFRLRGTADAARLAAAAAELDYAMTERNIELSITRAYWMLYQLRQVEIFAFENVRRLQSYRDDTGALVSAGARTQSDLLHVEVQLANARIGLVEARNNAKLALMELNNLLGQPTDTPITLTSRPEEDHTRYDHASLSNLRTLIDDASARRNDLKAAGTRVEAASASISAAQGQWWPQVELNANYLYNKPNARYQPITPEFFGSWDVGISVAFEIWNWGATSSRVEQAEAAHRQAQLQELHLKEEIVLEVHQAILNVEMTSEKVALSVLALSQAGEHLKDVTEKYRSGLVTSTELLDAEVALLQTQTQSSGASVEYALAQAALDRALGSEQRFGKPKNE